MLGYLAAMNRVACDARPALLAIHVDEVQVALAIAKASQFCRGLIHHHRLLVTRKAQGIVRHIELGVERCREDFGQQSRIARAVHLMARLALPGAHGAMQERARGDFSLD